MNGGWLGGVTVGGWRVGMMGRWDEWRPVGWWDDV